MRQRHPLQTVVPVVLRCSRASCLERIAQRHAADPSRYDPPERFGTDPRLLGVFAFVEAIDEA